jgi:hypothetical protein
MERQVWTDERIDDMVERLENSIDLLREDMREMRVEMREMRGDINALRTDMVAGFTSIRRDMLFAVLTMTGALVATMAAILATTV